MNIFLAISGRLGVVRIRWMRKIKTLRLEQLPRLEKGQDELKILSLALKFFLFY